MIDVSKIIETAREASASYAPTVLDVSLEDGLEVPILLTPDGDGGYAHHSVKAEVDLWRKEYEEYPKRRKGVAKLTELDSFIAHLKRFRCDSSAVFVSGDVTKPTFTSVLDYHDALWTEPKKDSDVIQGSDGDAADEPVANTEALPRYGEHRGVYTPEFSDEWRMWAGASGKWMTQGAFSELVNTNVRDVREIIVNEVMAESTEWYWKRFGRGREMTEFYASPERMLEIAEGLVMTMTDKIGQISRRDSGEIKVTFEAERSTDVEVPVAFLLEIPVFQGGELWQLPCRLRVRLKQQGETRVMEWSIELFGAARTVKAVLDEMRETIIQATGLPIFAGTPEG